MRVSVVGQGYVGLPLSVLLVNSGHEVVAVESNGERFAALLRGESYIEDISDEELSHVLKSGRFYPVQNLHGTNSSEVYLITVPTPIDADRKPDLRFLYGALETISENIRTGALVIIESTVYPGATRYAAVPYFEKISNMKAGVDVYFVYSPERIDPGRKDNYLEVPKIVGALDEAGLKLASSFYETVFKKVFPVSGVEVAEFVKLFENTFRYVNVAFVNELSQGAAAMNLNFREVVAAAASKPYGYMPFSHGPGVGGHCLPNNIYYLNHALSKVGRPSALLAASAKVNDSVSKYVAERLEEMLEGVGKRLDGAEVLILGLAYKANVSDDRSAPTYAIVGELVQRGADVSVVDPHVPLHEANGLFVRADLTADLCAHADAVLIVTDHEDFDYGLVIDNAQLILDCRGKLNHSKVVQL
jgi:UDP-N-acetyl-D-glucosamine dehydrogenase